MKNGFKIIDSDMHIMEPLDLWDNYMDPRFKDRGPRPVRVPTRGDLNLLLIDGKEPRQQSPTLAHDVRMISGKRSNTRGDVIDFARRQTSTQNPSSKPWTSRALTSPCCSPLPACIS